LEIKELSAKFSTDIIGSTAYGLNVNSFNNPDAEFRKYGRKIFEITIIRGFEFFAIFFVPSIIPAAGIKVFNKESTKFLRNVFSETLTQRAKSGIKRNDLIDLLIELKKTHGDQDIEGFSK